MILFTLYQYVKFSLRTRLIMIIILKTLTDFGSLLGSFNLLGATNEIYLEAFIESQYIGFLLYDSLISRR